ncbi:MAG: hypothetical protein HKL95_05465 [Phycisphaerae bacterium]|nr:hypothetical protein [Phycisphaerae bacterium]
MTRRNVVAVGMLFFWLSVALPPASAYQPAVMDLQHILAAFRRMHGLAMYFICKKRLAVLKQPFISGGSIAMMQPDGVRFTTLWPYRSCFILHGNRVYMRTENNRRWHVGQGSRQEVVRRMMQEFARWSLGRAQDISRAYHVQETVGRVAVPPPPQAPRMPPRSKQRPFPKSLRLFTLIPTSPTVRHAVKFIRLGFSGGHPQLRWIEIKLVGGNKSCYWLTHIRTDPHFVPDEFQPKGPP